MVKLIYGMKKDFEIMTKCIKDSSMKVNESKTESCGGGGGA
jgi:hypothetical protein